LKYRKKKILQGKEKGTGSPTLFEREQRKERGDPETEPRRGCSKGR